MTLNSETAKTRSLTLHAIFSCARAVGETENIEKELIDLASLFRSLWNAMSDNGRILFHRSRASIDYVFNCETDPLGRLYLDGADAYYGLVRGNRAAREEDACGPEWVAGDMEELIRTAWDCLGASEKGKALASSEIGMLIAAYKERGFWRRAWEH
jgi:hypothetical protein